MTLNTDVRKVPKLQQNKPRHHIHFHVEVFNLKNHRTSYDHQGQPSQTRSCGFGLLSLIAEFSPSWKPGFGVRFKMSNVALIKKKISYQNLVFVCYNRSTNNPDPSISPRYSYQGKRQEPGNLQTKRSSF
jgi:hypothetical protein